MQSETEILKEFYAALNRNDIPAIVKLLDPQILRVEFAGSPSAGACQGLEEVKEHFIKGRSTWAEGSCKPEDFITAGDKVVVPVYVKVRLKNKQEWNEGNIADGFAFKSGKITEFRSFFKKEEALEWAGI